MTFIDMPTFELGMTDNRSDFIGALLSSQYVQTTGTLYRGKNTNRPMMCCMGVATDRYIRATPGEKWLTGPSDYYSFRYNESSMEPQVQRWLGLDDANPTLWNDTNHLLVGEWQGHSAGGCNDSEDFSFQEIAYLFHHLFTTGQPFSGTKDVVKSNARIFVSSW